MMNKKTSRIYTLFLRFLYSFAFTKSDRRAMGCLLILIALTVFLRAYGLVRPAKEWRVKQEETLGLLPKKTQTKSFSETQSDTRQEKWSSSRHVFSPRQNSSELGVARLAESKRSRTPYTPPAYMVKKPFVLDLNTADTLDLQELHGIGPAYARRIVNYREKLGGFVQVEQLREVWGIDSGLLEKIRVSVYVKEPVLRKLALNEADLRTLKQHPYLDYYQAKEIYLHRQKYGAFSNLEDLRKVNLMDSGTFKRLLPYVRLDSPKRDSANPHTQTDASESK